MNIIQNILQNYAKNLNIQHFYTEKYAILCIKNLNLDSFHAKCLQR
jgi:hypothetical protein